MRIYADLCQGRVQHFSQSSTMWDKTYNGLIAGYTDREDLEAFIWSNTGGEQRGRGRPPTRRGGEETANRAFQDSR